MSLTTGRRLSRHQWTLIPMTDAVVARVEAMAEAEGQLFIAGGALAFEWQPDVPIDNSDDDDDDNDDNTPGSNGNGDDTSDDDSDYCLTATVTQMIPMTWTQTMTSRVMTIVMRMMTVVMIIPKTRADRRYQCQY